jgi:hypothetical protein
MAVSSVLHGSSLNQKVWYGVDLLQFKCWYRSFTGEDVANDRQRLGGLWNYDIFVSHAGEDKAFALRLREKFKDVGLNAFVDESDLQGGDYADNHILDAVKEAPVGLALLSKHYLEKEWPIRELKAIVGKTTLLPVLYNITHEAASTTIANTPQAEAYDAREWKEFTNQVRRTAAVKNTSNSYDESPFVQLVVFSAVQLCVKLIGPRAATISSNRVWAFYFVTKVRDASLQIVNTFKRLDAEQIDKAKNWFHDMRLLAEHLLVEGA